MAQHATSPDSWIADRLGAPQRKFREFASAVYSRCDALDGKTKELISVAASSVGRCPHCTDGHLAKAAEAGATEEEIAEALAVAWVQGGGTQIAWMVGDYADILGEDWRQELIGEADRAFWAFEREVFENGAKPSVTKHLIAVAVASMLRCPHCTRSHMEAALDAGASRAQVAEALAVLWVIGAGVQIVWDEEGFEEHLGAAIRV